MYIQYWVPKKYTRPARKPAAKASRRPSPRMADSRGTSATNASGQRPGFGKLRTSIRPESTEAGPYS